MNKSKDERFRDRVYKLVGEEYEVIGEYIKARDKILIKHNLCENEYKVTPDNFVNKGTRCPRCFGGVRKTNEEFLREFRSLVGDEYSPLEEYVNTNHPLQIIHTKCGYVFKMSPSAFIHQGQRCPDCAINRRRRVLTLTNDEFLEGIHEMVGSEYTFLEKYKGGDTKIKIRHNICGNEYEVAPRRFKSGNRCRQCNAMSQRKSSEEFVSEVKELTLGEYEVVGKYETARSLLEFKHVKCGSVFSSTPNNFLSGNRCPDCYYSKGEQRISEYLDERGVIYGREVVFSDLKMEGLLRYDFGVYDRNGKMKLLVEYDGQHHYRPIEAWGGNEEFERVKKSDEIKNEYASKNNIPLKRIPYWEYDRIDRLLGKAIDEIFKNEKESDNI